MSSPIVVVLPALIGGVVLLAALHLWLWLGRRGDNLALWVAAWCGTTLLYLAGHYVQITAPTPSGTVAGARLSLLAALVLIPVIIGLTQALAGQRPSPRVVVPAILVSAILAVLGWTTELFLTRQVYERTDLLGVHYPAVMPGPLMPVLAPYIVATFVYIWFASLRSSSAALPSDEWRLVRAGFALYILCGVHDVLHAARLIQSVRLFDFAFVGVAVGLAYLLTRRHNQLHARLEEEVKRRTSDLGARRAEMDALLRAGQMVMAGLDLETALRRIVEEAGRITGSPHIKLLLVDQKAGVLRMGALSGGTVPPDFQVPLGQSYSGTVAVTGEPLFVADTQNDPRNLLAQRDRDEGIRTYLGLPVRKGSEVLGVLTINTAASHVYAPEELAYLASFADQAAVAIDSARLYGDARQREKRLATLTTLTQSLTATLSLDEVLDRVVRQAMELLGSSSARLWLIDEDGAALTLRAHAGAVTDVVGITRLAVGEGLMGRIVESRAALVIEDLESYMGMRNVERRRAEGVASFAGVPLLLGHRILGALAIASRERRRIADEELSVLQALGNHAAIAIENARLFESAESRAQELGALHEVHSALASTLEQDAVLQTVASLAARLVGADSSILYELDPRDGLLHKRTAHGLGPEHRFYPTRLGQGAAGAAALRGEPVWSHDVREQPVPGHDELLEGAGATMGEVMSARPHRAVLALPLVSRDKAFGSIAVFWNQVHQPSRGEIRLLTAFANQAAMALEHARLYAALEKRLDRLETLTGLNRLISSSLDSGHVLQEISRAAAQLMDVPVASFWLADETTRTLEMVSFFDAELAADYPNRRLPYEQGMIGWVGTHRRSLQVADFLSDARPSRATAEWAKSHGLRSFYGVPVLHEGALLAVLGLMGRQPIQLQAEDESLLQAFVAQAAVAIRNASLYEAEGVARREAELALAQVKQLQGMLPICAYCKKIRNDRNYWETIEGYIGERSQATFSHGICPDCRQTVVAAELAEWKRRQARGAN